MNDAVRLPTIESLVAEHANNQPALVAALIEREDTMADMFRMAGMQFGLYPQIVAEVFADVGIGTPVDENQRAMIHQQFVTLMQELQQQFGQGQ